MESIKKKILLWFILQVITLLFIPKHASGENRLDFTNWSNEQFKHYEDSLIATLYPSCPLHTLDTLLCDSLQSKLRKTKSKEKKTNTYVPISIDINRECTVGEIPIKSDVSALGAKIYKVPIESYNQGQGLKPNIALSYNSSSGNSVLGMGWSITGLSSISRINRDIFHDGNVGSVELNNKDALTLDGIRLIKIGENIYASEFGNIRVKAIDKNDVIAQFEVYYPDGNKGIFGFDNDVENAIAYPITHMEDMNGNVVTYAYDRRDNTNHIKEIKYNNASVLFEYDRVRPDTLTVYAAGYKSEENQRLIKIHCKYEEKILRTYIMDYSQKRGRSYLFEIHVTSGDKSYNPLKFYYGSGIQYLDFVKDNTYLLKWYESENAARLKTTKGKFDYENNTDGIVVYPGYNPYVKIYRNSTLFSHSVKQFYNSYPIDQEILLYAGIKGGEFATPMPNLITEKGFIDILCADLKGDQKEQIIKINNYVEDNYDKIIFKVYDSSALNGIRLSYTRTFKFPTVFTDKGGNQSVHPKFYHVGDFNGDGKMEIMAISVHNSYDDPNMPSICYIFDLEGNRILFNKHVFPYNIEFIGTLQENPLEAENNSDKVFVMDYNGDGRSDICHISDRGLTIYEFESNGTIITSKEICTNTNINKNQLKGKDYFPCDFNGDGKTDLLLSATIEDRVAPMWELYNSKGNGRFEYSRFRGPQKTTTDKSEFTMQDMNGDGLLDLIQYDYLYFSSTYVHNNKLQLGYGNIESIDASKFTVIPAERSSRNTYANVICLKDSLAINYSLNSNERVESLLTGMINSLGVVEKTDYQLMSDADDKVEYNGDKYDFHTTGTGAVYPFVNLNEALPIVSATTTYLGGKQIDKSMYLYDNGIYHRQGLGFQGFSEISKLDCRGEFYKQIFDPFVYGILKKEIAPESETSYDYNLTINNDQTKQLLLSKKNEKDKLRGIWEETIYKYDKFGSIANEIHRFSNDLACSKSYEYDNFSDISKGYRIGLITKQTESSENAISCVKNTICTKYNNKYQPIYTRADINDCEERRCVYEYDGNGNIRSETIIPFETEDNKRITTFEYDNAGHVIKEVNPLGLIKEYSYNENGLLKCAIDPRGCVKEYQYDDFARNIKIIYPDGTESTKQYTWAENDYSCYNIEYKCTGKPDTLIVYDALNREIQVSDQMSNGNMRNVRTEYDEYGNKCRESLPYISDLDKEWDTYRYDKYNRLIEIKRASGESVSYRYEDNTVEETKNGIVIKTKYDAQGNIIEIQDGGGTVTYAVEADGLLGSVIAPNGIETTFDYDDFRRRIRIKDPSHGTMYYEYDNVGNLGRTIDAKGDTITYSYDKFGRIVKTISKETNVSVGYNEFGDISYKNSNGMGYSRYYYDIYGRIREYYECGNEDMMTLSKSFSYKDGNISSITYQSEWMIDGVSEHYKYNNGHLTEIVFKDGVSKQSTETTVYHLDEENQFGQPTRVTLGVVTAELSYSQYGLPSRRNVHQGINIFLDEVYDFDDCTHNLNSRKDNSWGKTDNFKYDKLNRLVSENEREIEYDCTGNILYKRKVGTYSYDNSLNPYAISSLNLDDDNTLYGSMSITQSVKYSSFMRPLEISQDSYRAIFEYNAEYDRNKMVITRDGTRELVRFYLGGCYEHDKLYDSSGKNINREERLYIGGDYYSASAVYIVRESPSNDKGLYYIIRDYLGSIRCLVRADGMKYIQPCYDAWGRIKHPISHEYCDPEDDTTSPPNLLIGRGYCGHEYLPQFGLINMNARLYDPILGRFLSPDSQLQLPYNSQNFNRYTYGLNNPLYYIDQDGEFFFIPILVAAGIGGAANLICKGLNGQIHNIGDAFSAFGIGAVAGGVGFATGGWAAGLVGGAAGGFFTGAIGGFVGSAASMPFLSVGNNQAFGDPLFTAKEYAIGIVSGSLLGGMYSGMKALYDGRNFWNGNEIQYGRNAFSINNTPLPKPSDAHYTLYRGIGDNGSDYVGMTGREPEIRISEHLRSKTLRSGLSYKISASNFTKIEARIWEQRVINSHKQGILDIGCINMRNEISPTLWHSYRIPPPSSWNQIYKFRISFELKTRIRMF